MIASGNEKYQKEEHPHPQIVRKAIIEHNKERQDKFKKKFSEMIQKHKSSGIRQKGESQNGCFKKVKHAKFPKNKHFLPPDTHTTRFEIHLFALLPTK